MDGSSVVATGLLGVGGPLVTLRSKSWKNGVEFGKGCAVVSSGLLTFLSFPFHRLLSSWSTIPWGCSPLNWLLLDRTLSS